MPPAETIKVLLVEDNPYDAKIVEDLISGIKQDSYSLRMAEDLRSAGAADAAEHADVVLLDLNLPDSYGQDTLLKSKALFTDRPIIVMTGRYEERLGLQLIKKGAQDYIVKGKLSAESLGNSIRYSIERAAAERRLREAEESLLGLIGKMSEGVLVVTGGGKVVFASPAAEVLLGRNGEHLLSLPYGLPAAPEAPISMDLLRHDGKKVPLEIRETAISWQGNPCRMILLRDLTAERQLEYNRGEFISSVSHELRSPLTVVKEALGIISDGSAGEPTKMQKELARMGIENVHRLNRIIDSLLDITKMEAGIMPLDMEKCELSSLLGEISGEYSLLGAEAGIEVRCVRPPEHMTGFCDRDKLMEVLTNLASNALKFTPRGGTVTFSLERWEGQALFKVENTGPGIAPEDLHKLFGKFAKLNSPGGSGEKGSGLGLAISRGIMEMHGGRIWAESEPGKYCRFFLLLPLRGFRDTALALAGREIGLAADKSEFCAIALALPEKMHENPGAVESPAYGFCRRMKRSMRSSHAKMKGNKVDMAIFLPDCGIKDCARHFSRIQKELESKGLTPEEAAGSITALVYPSDFREPAELADRLSEIESGKGG